MVSLLRIGLLSALVLAPLQLIGAQEISQPPRYHASWWTRDDGLPGNWVPDVTQDVAGRLWFIAGGVLTRYDGRELEVVELGGSWEGISSTGLPIDIERGAGDTLWVSTDANQVLAHTRGRWVSVYQAAGPLTLLRSRPGVPLTAVERHGLRLHFWQGGRRLDLPDRVASEQVNGPTIALDTAGALWAVEEGSNTASEVSEGRSRRLEVADGGFVGFGADEGPLGVRRQRGRLEIIDVAGRVRASIPDSVGRVPLHVARDGRVLAATPTHLEIYHGGLPPARVSLRPGARVRVVFEDREGGFWIGTEAHGLVRLRPTPFTVLRPTTRDGVQSRVNAVGRGVDGTILMVADSLLRVRGTVVEAVDLTGLPPAAILFAALEDSEGALWVGILTQDDENLVVVRRADGGVEQFRAAGQVMEIVEALDGSLLWLTEGEFCRAPAGSARSRTPTCTDLGDLGAHGLLVGRDGTVWIAGREGVRAERDGVVRLYGVSEGYPLARARALHEDARGAIWIGTYYGGLGRLAGDSLRMIRRADGLAEDVVSAILESDGGTFWMGGNEGIHAARRETLEAFLAGEVSRVPSRTLGRREGLSDAEGMGRQGVKGADGRLWFPTFGGAVAVDPASADSLVVSPGRVTLGRITAGDSVYAVSDTVWPPMGVRDFQVSLAAASLHSPGSVWIEYRLEGRSTRWTPVGEAGILDLHGLGPGSHRLEVRAVAPDAGQAPSVAATVIVVPPRFSETVWFLALLAVLMAGLVALGVWGRTLLLQRRARELADEVREQTHWLEVERDRSAAALERVAETSARLRELLLAKSRVFAGLSHELRGPMSLITEPLRELEREAGASFPPAARGYLGTLANAVRRLERLTAQFLDLADTQSGTLRLRRREIDVAEFVGTCVATMRPVADRRQVHLSLEVPETPIRAELDPDHLDKVVLNLVENAIRHTPKGEAVDVRLRSGDGEGGLVIEVQDKGPGVPPEHRDGIFEPFFQAPDATEGMGLGLSLSRDVVLLHGGRIEVDGPQGAGAIFRVTLPVAGHPAGATSAEGHAAGGIAPVAPASPAPEEAPAGPRDRVLVVEDDSEIRAYLSEQLGRGYEVRTAPGGEEALDLLRDWSPHLVISDVLMAGLDGLGLCRILKADPATRTIPVILLTGLGDRDHQLQGFASGADAYVVKPFDMEQLLLRVSNLLTIRRGIEDRFQATLPAWASILYRSGADRLDTRSEEFLARFYKTLLEGLGNPDLDVDGIAKKLHMSRSSLYRRVRALLDCSPLDVLAEVRLEQAALHLRTSGDAVSTIASRVGFRSAEHFTRRFVAHFGLAPRSYRGQSRLPRSG